MLGRRELLASRFSASGEALPESRGQWDALVAEYTQLESEYQQRKTELHGLQYPLIDAQKKAEQRIKALEKDLERKRQSKTRISSDMDEARNMIARATGLSPQELPYAAELMDVGEENEEWRTAMNVAYRSLATVILVDSRHENGFAAKVSQISGRRSHDATGGSSTRASMWRLRSVKGGCRASSRSTWNLRSSIGFVPG